jgi:hypothetical protein
MASLLLAMRDGFLDIALIEMSRLIGAVHTLLYADKFSIEP